MSNSFASAFPNYQAGVRIKTAEDISQVKKGLRSASFYSVSSMFAAMFVFLCVPGALGSLSSVPGVLASAVHGNQSELRLGQNDESEQNEISTDQIEKYVSVYKAMQRNRSLTVDQAAAQQGLTVEQFRELENRVQRDDAALQQARDELQAAAARSTSSPTSGAAPLR